MKIKPSMVKIYEQVSLIGHIKNMHKMKIDAYPLLWYVNIRREKILLNKSFILHKLRKEYKLTFNVLHIKLKYGPPLIKWSCYGVSHLHGYTKFNVK